MTQKVLKLSPMTVALKMKFPPIGTFGPPSHMKIKVMVRLKKRSERSYGGIDDQKRSGGSDTIVPEVSDDVNNEKIVDNESPRG